MSDNNNTGNNDEVVFIGDLNDEGDVVTTSKTEPPRLQRRVVDFATSADEVVNLDDELRNSGTGDALAQSASMSVSQRRAVVAERKVGAVPEEKLTDLQRRIRQADKKFLENCRIIFEKFDADNSGSIDKSELTLVLESMGYALTQDQVQELLAQVDVDGGGSLDIDEFSVLIQLWKEAAQYKIFESDASVSKQHIDHSADMKISALLDDGKWRWAWQVVLMLVAMYFWMTVWVMWNWNNDPSERLEVERNLLAPDVVCTFILIVEMVLRFRIGFLSDGDKLVDDKWQIAMRYFRTWFLYDLITMLPLRFFTTDPEVAFWMRHVRLLLVVRIPFLFNKSKMVNITSTYVNFHFAFLPFFELFIAFTCIILTLAMVRQELVRQDVALGVTDPKEGTFAAAIYWTMYCVAGVGYGDMVPHTDHHRWFTSFLFVFAMVSNGFIIGSMVTIMQEADVESSRQTRLVQTQAVLNFFEVPAGLQAEILQFQNHTLERDIAISYSDLVESLPEDMRESILMQSRVPLLRAVTIFTGTHVSTLVQVATRLQQSTAVPEQYVAIFGEENFCLFIINYGFLDCIGPNGHYITTLKREDSFGEPGVLRDGVRFEISFKSLTYCDLFALTREDLDEVASRFPRFAADLRAKKLLVKCKYTEILREHEMERRRLLAEELSRKIEEHSDPNMIEKAIVDGVTKVGTAVVSTLSDLVGASVLQEEQRRSLDAKMMVTLTGATANEMLTSARDIRRRSSSTTKLEDVADEGDALPQLNVSDLPPAVVQHLERLDSQAHEAAQQIEALERAIHALLAGGSGGEAATATS